jgi:hypothetical protein
MIYKNVSDYVAARAAHRVLGGRPFFADLDISDPPAVLARAEALRYPDAFS